MLNSMLKELKLLFITYDYINILNNVLIYNYGHSIIFYFVIFKKEYLIVIKGCSWLKELL